MPEYSESAYTSWREYLSTIINSAKEKQRVAEELGIQAITLNRWISGESIPRSHNLRQLLNALPMYREQLFDLIKQEPEFEDFTSSPQEDNLGDISSDFYVKLFSTRSSSTPNLRFWSLCNSILQQALLQIDPNRLGISIWIVLCMPPSGPNHKVRSLRESVGLGNPPWKGNLEQRAMFLGAESLAGNVVTLCRPSIVENLDDEHTQLPFSRVDYEESSAVYPILYAGRIAGVFLVSSAQPNFFSTLSRSHLIQRYADLVALSLDPEDFYAPEDIALRIMPTHDEQKPYFANFRQRVANVMIEASLDNRYVSNVDADKLVWKQLEDEFLNLLAKDKIDIHGSDNHNSLQHAIPSRAPERS